MEDKYKTYYNFKYTMDILSSNGLNKMEQVNYGIASSTYVCSSESGEKYFLKLIEEDTDNRLNNEIDAVLHFQNRPYVPEIIDYQYDDEMKAVLYNYVESYYDPMEKDKQKYANSIRHTALILNLIHQASPIDTKYGIDYKERYANECDITVDPDTQDHNFSVTMTKKPVIEFLKDCSWNSETPIHGDVYHNNIRYNSDGTLRSLTDWDLSGNGDPIFDLAKTETWICDILSYFYDNRDINESRNLFRNTYDFRVINMKKYLAYKSVYADRIAHYIVDNNSVQFENVTDEDVFECFSSIINKTTKESDDIL